MPKLKSYISNIIFPRINPVTTVGIFMMIIFSLLASITRLWLTDKNNDLIILFWFYLAAALVVLVPLIILTVNASRNYDKEIYWRVFYERILYSVFIGAGSFSIFAFNNSINFNEQNLINQLLNLVALFYFIKSFLLMMTSLMLVTIANPNDANLDLPLHSRIYEKLLKSYNKITISKKMIRDIILVATASVIISTLIYEYINQIFVFAFVLFSVHLKLFGKLSPTIKN